jgi:hypothetical protein
MKTLLSALIFLSFAFPAFSQPTHGDSLYFVRLMDGTTLYSNKVKLVNSFSRGKYLLLDSNRQIPLSQARTFKGWDGTFAVANTRWGFDAFKLQNEGRKISLFSQCYYETETYYTSTTPNGPDFPTTISYSQRVIYFRKGDSGDIQRLTYGHLRDAVADNPASAAQIRVAGVNLYLGVGLLAAGTALTVAGFIQTAQRNNAAYNAFKTASANWYIQAQQNPNTPMPTAATHYGVSALTIIGAVASLSAVIPLVSVNSHVRRALDIYNGIE